MPTLRSKNLVEVEVAERLVACRTLLRTLEGLGKFFIEQLIAILFRIDRLLKEALLPLLGLAHGLRRGFKALEGPLVGRRRVMEHRAGLCIYGEHRAAIRAGDF